ncbi:MAG: hypothetical protein KAQ75_01715 [Bacteroidales bacterium]|nr:hypothetical protein [Bacteroidales bacterium]
MKKIITILTLSLVIQTSLFSQVKMWNKELKVEKSKGMFCTLETREIKPIEKDSKAFIASATIVGTLLPYAIKYGNYAFKKATGKDEKNYKSESSSLNKLILKSKTLNDSIVIISANQFFYKKGDTCKDTATKYSFTIQKKDSSLNIIFTKAEEHFSPVKLKKKYDLIITNFNISVQARVIEQIDGVKSKQKIIDLGTSTIYRINPSFRLSNGEIINQGNYLIPKYSDKGKIVIKEFIISFKINHVNPYGLTTSSLNDFLEKNSDTNEELLNTIFIKKE